MADNHTWNSSFVNNTPASGNWTHPSTILAKRPPTCAPSEPLSADFQVALYCLVIVVSIIGNTLVIFVVTRNPRMHSVANYLICNMCVADLLITLLPMTWEVVKLRHYPDGTWPMGAFMCPFTYMCIYVSVACSILTLTLISLDRYFAVIHPFKQYITMDRLPFLLIAIWVISLAFACPVIFAQKQITDGAVTYCVENWKSPFNAEESPKHYTIILFIGLYAAPLVVMAFLYTLIGIKLWRRNIPGSKICSTKMQALKQKRNAIKMLVCVLAIFAICWFPVFFAQFSFFFDPTYISCPKSFPRFLQFLAFFMQYLSSSVNPFIYFTFSRAFRVGFVFAFRSSSYRRRRNTFPTTSRFHGRSTWRDASSPQEHGFSAKRRAGTRSSVVLTSIKEKQME